MVGCKSAHGFTFLSYKTFLNLEGVMIGPFAIAVAMLCGAAAAGEAPPSFPVEDIYRFMPAVPGAQANMQVACNARELFREQIRYNDPTRLREYDEESLWRINVWNVVMFLENPVSARWRYGIYRDDVTDEYIIPFILCELCGLLGEADYAAGRLPLPCPNVKIPTRTVGE